MEVNFEVHYPKKQSKKLLFYTAGLILASKRKKPLGNQTKSDFWNSFFRKTLGIAALIGAILVKIDNKLREFFNPPK